jgi:hypothetical protein
VKAEEAKAEAAPKGDPVKLEATIVPLGGLWLLILAAVRRALAPDG